MDKRGRCSEEGGLCLSLSLNEVSKLGETERDLIRLKQITREKRDKHIEKLRQKYASALARLDERIRRAKMTLEEQQAHAKSREYEATVSLGETIFRLVSRKVKHPCHKGDERNITHYEGKEG